MAQPQARGSPRARAQVACRGRMAGRGPPRMGCAFQASFTEAYGEGPLFGGEWGRHINKRGAASLPARRQGALQSTSWIHMDPSMVRSPAGFYSPCSRAPAPRCSRAPARAHLVSAPHRDLDCACCTGYCPYPAFGHSCLRFGHCCLFLQGRQGQRLSCVSLAARQL